MNIAVVDVAASEGGALSVLNEFCRVLRNVEKGENHWYIFTSTVNVEENEFVHNLRYPAIKKSWINRIKWERDVLPNILQELSISVVFSLQNNAFRKGSYRQVVYFHNILMLQKFGSFINFKSYNANLAIRANILGPYIRHGWKNANVMIVQGESVKSQLSRCFDKKNIEVIRPNVYCPPEYRNAAGKIKGYIYPTSGFSYKNIEAIVNAEKILNANGESIEVLITIDGKENNYTKTIVKNARNVRGLSFIGQQSKECILKLYKEYGLIMPSKLESFGFPIIEAMMVGTVVVGLKLPYFIELTKNYSRCYIADKENDLPWIMKQGLHNFFNGNFCCSKNESWEKIIDIVKQTQN